MDDIYQLGLTNLFIEIGLLVIKKLKIETLYAHLDSTSFHFELKYNHIKTTEKYQKRPILITRGYSRDHRLPTDFPGLPKILMPLIFCVL